jgi:hypothetical protein
MQVSLVILIDRTHYAAGVLNRRRAAERVRGIAALFVPRSPS